MGIDLLAIVDSYYQTVKSDWGSAEHNIARRVVREMAQARNDILVLNEENKRLKAQHDQAVEALRPFAALAKVMRGRGYESYIRVSGYNNMKYIIKAGDYYNAEAAIAIAATEDE